MSILIASGNLLNVSQNDPHIVTSLYTGRFGVQLSGTFGATGKVVMASGTRGDNTIRSRVIDVNNASTARYLEFTQAGLYLVEFFLEVIEIRLIQGTNGVTDIDYNLFVGVRP